MGSWVDLMDGQVSLSLPSVPEDPPSCLGEGHMGAASVLFSSGEE